MNYTESQGTPIAAGPATSPMGIPAGVPVCVAPPSAPTYAPATLAEPMYPPLPVGYAHCHDKSEPAPPPPPMYDDIMGQPTRQIHPYQVSQMDENEVRAAVARHVSGKILYSSSAVQQMAYSNIIMNVAYVYRLETFYEKRETKWIVKAHDPCNQVDGPQNGPIPSPWDVMISPATEFKNDKRKVPVPHSEHIQQCHRCLGRGNVQCKHCNGIGYKCCSGCKGLGYRMTSDGNKNCSSCKSTGRDGCTWCSSKGFKKCDVCTGHGTLKYSIQLKVTWSVREDIFVSNSCGLKDKLLREATGSRLMHEECRDIHPISSQEFMDQAIVGATKALLDKHKSQASDQAVIRQRHSLTAIPIALVNYTRKGTPGSFFVYGESNDRRAHFDHYPSKNCVIS